MDELVRTVRYLHGKEEEYEEKDIEDYTREYVWSNGNSFGLQIISESDAIEINIINTLFTFSNTAKISGTTRKGDTLQFSFGNFETIPYAGSMYTPLPKQDYIFEVIEYKKKERIEI
jgi:hypothetical protein